MIPEVSSQREPRGWAKKQDSKVDTTYNGNFAAKVILDLPSFDGIGGIFCNDLVQFWNLAISLKVLGTIEKEMSSRLIPIFHGSHTELG